jgi:uncharacterized protein
MNMESDIAKFLHKHHLLTLATSANNISWCASCFYVFDDNNIQFIITSDPSTRHASEMTEQPIVSGTVALETSVIGKIRGIQFTGKAYQPKDHELKSVQAAYLKRFPYAILMKTHLWIVMIDSIKFTDNRLGFGKKKFWQRST